MIKPDFTIPLGNAMREIGSHARRAFTIFQSDSSSLADMTSTAKRRFPVLRGRADAIGALTAVTLFVSTVGTIGNASASPLNGADAAAIRPGAIAGAQISGAPTPAPRG
jgi:hypothetical protein